MHIEQPRPSFILPNTNNSGGDNPYATLLLGSEEPNPLAVLFQQGQAAGVFPQGVNLEEFGEDQMMAVISALQLQQNISPFSVDSGAQDPQYQLLQSLFEQGQGAGVLPQNISFEQFGPDRMTSFLSLMQQSQNNGFPEGTAQDNHYSTIMNLLNSSGLSTQINEQTTQNSSLQALNMAALNNQGIFQQQLIQQQGEAENLELDLDLLRTRNNYNVFTKQVEQFLLDRQVQERLENLFFELERTKMQNRFSLAKTAVGAARYS